MSKVLEALGDALDKESYQWMSDNHPDLVASLEKAVAKGVTDLEIRRFVMAQTGRQLIALRCQQVAHHIERLED